MKFVKYKDIPQGAVFKCIDKLVNRSWSKDIFIKINPYEDLQHVNINNFHLYLSGWKNENLECLWFDEIYLPEYITNRVAEIEKLQSILANKNGV